MTATMATPNTRILFRCGDTMKARNCISIWGSSRKPITDAGLVAGTSGGLLDRSAIETSLRLAEAYLHAPRWWYLSANAPGISQTAIAAVARIPSAFINVRQCFCHARLIATLQKICREQLENLTKGHNMCA